MQQGRLAGQRILVVGASSGIGRALALQLSREGARVVAAARRADRLDALAEEAASGLIPQVCDVRDARSCDDGVARGCEALGGLDALVYAAGIATLRDLSDADAETWREAFEINVVGPSLVTRAAIPHLVESRGRAVFLSSIAAHDRPPRRGLGLYTTTKSALDRLVECWQEEARAVAFTRVSVGDTLGTEMASTWDPSQMGARVGEWSERGYLIGRLMTVDDVAHHIVDLLASREAVPVSSILPRYPD